MLLHYTSVHMSELWLGMHCGLIITTINSHFLRMFGCLFTQIISELTFSFIGKSHIISHFIAIQPWKFYQFYERFKSSIQL